MRRLSIALFVCLATAVPAQAQIYTWRDASGTMVLSNKPQGGGERTQVATYAVPGAPLLKTTSKPPKNDQGSRYDDLIRQHSDTHGISAHLVRAVIQAESGFNPMAVSPKGAQGLMQLMPATARELGVFDAFVPSENIRGGVAYLAGLLSKYKQNVEFALAAYNAGPASVDRYDGVPPYRETRDYVKRITGATLIAAPPPPPPPPPPVIYKWVEVVNGRAVNRYSNTQPKDIASDIVVK